MQGQGSEGKTTLALGSADNWAVLTSRQVRGALCVVLAQSGGVRDVARRCAVLETDRMGAHGCAHSPARLT